MSSLASVVAMAKRWSQFPSGPSVRPRGQRRRWAGRQLEAVDRFWWLGPFVDQIGKNDAAALLHGFAPGGALVMDSERTFDGWTDP